MHVMEIVSTTDPDTKSDPGIDLLVHALGGGAINNHSANTVSAL